MKEKRWLDVAPTVLSALLLLAFAALSLRGLIAPVLHPLALALHSPPPWRGDGWPPARAKAGRDQVGP